MLRFSDGWGVREGDELWSRLAHIRPFRIGRIVRIVGRVVSFETLEAWPECFLDAAPLASEPGAVSSLDWPSGFDGPVLITPGAAVLGLWGSEAAAAKGLRV